MANKFHTTLRLDPHFGRDCSSRKVRSEHNLQTGFQTNPPCQAAWCGCVAPLWFNPWPLCRTVTMTRSADPTNESLSLYISFYLVNLHFLNKMYEVKPMTTFEPVQYFHPRILTVFFMLLSLLLFASLFLTDTPYIKPFHLFHLFHYENQAASSLE